jgi:hypothetical protein
MTQTLTRATELAIKKTNLGPQLVLEIDGLETIFAAQAILKVIKIGDVNLFIDGTWTIGGLNGVPNQEEIITFGSDVGGGTTTKLNQQINTDTGESNSITSMDISLIDKDNIMTRIISPNVVLDDVIGRRCKVWLGFVGTAFKDDYVVIHRGIIQDVVSSAGVVTLSISHPDQKKRQQLFTKIDSKLNGSITNSQTTIDLDDASKFITPITGPDGLIDPDFECLVKIGDELIKYTGKSVNQLTGCVRGYNLTTAASHSDDDQVSAVYKITGNIIINALKMMLSGWNGPCLEDIDSNSFVLVDGVFSITNALSFKSNNIERDYGITVGCYLSSSGALNGANNFTNKKVLDVQSYQGIQYVILDSVSLVAEVDSDAVISIRSQYDTWPIGLKMYSDEVDISEHERIYRSFLSSFSMRFVIDEQIEGKKFIEGELFKPASVFSVPRNSRSSLGYHIGPIPSSTVKTLGKRNIRNPKDLKLRRGASKNYYNTVIYKFEKVGETFTSGVVSTDNDSRTRIPLGTKALTIESLGLREDLQGVNLAVQASTRRLNRYKFGAEYIDNIKVMFADGFNIDVGDIVLLDLTDLSVSNTQAGDRKSTAKLYEVQNKTLDVKTGEITINVADTNFSTSKRYALISPASYLRTISNASQFTIESSFSSVFGSNEGSKWSRYVGAAVRIRKPDFSLVQTATIKSVFENTVTLNETLGTLPVTGDIMELADYSFVSENIKLLYGFMSNGPFADGKDEYSMI